MTSTHGSLSGEVESVATRLQEAAPVVDGVKTPGKIGNRGRLLQIYPASKTPLPWPVHRDNSNRRTPMRKRGVKLGDPVLDTNQIDWLVLSADVCTRPEEEYQIIASHFRKPHEPWGSSRAFVAPVRVRRGRYRILFWQQSGVES